MLPLKLLSLMKMIGTHIAVNTAGALKLKKCVVFAPIRKGNLGCKKRYRVQKVMQANNNIVSNVMMLSLALS